MTNTIVRALVGDRLPASMSPAELMGKLGYSRSVFYKYRAEGKFDRFLLANPIGDKCYSGRLVQAHLDSSAPVSPRLRMAHRD
jgi:hypothetical protein